MPTVRQIQKELDTTAMEQAMSKSTLGRRRWISKHMTGHFEHGKNMVRRNQRSMAQCTQWQATIEDKIHILQCLAPSARTQWHLSTAQLDRWMKDNGTATKV